MGSTTRENPVPFNQDDEMGQDQPIEELKDHTVDLNPDLGGRVHRSINRRSLAADSLDLSVNMFLRTVWTYTQAMFESLPGMNRNKED